MRHISFAALLLAATLGAGTAHATGNVLLPDSYSSSESDDSAPNLGLGPSSREQSKTAAPSYTTTAPTEKSPPSFQEDEQEIINSVKDKEAVANDYNTNLPQQENLQQLPKEIKNIINDPSYQAMIADQLKTIGSQIKIEDLKDINKIITPVNRSTAKNLPPNAIPTQVVNMPDPSFVMKMMNPNGQSTLSVQFGDKSYFGANDIQEITEKIGLQKDRVSSSCYLAPEGLLQTDMGSFPIIGGTAPKVSVRYDGIITDLSIEVRAACSHEGDLPPGSGLIRKMNNKYLISLQSVNCPSPKRQTSGVVVQYNGSSGSTCEYK